MELKRVPLDKTGAFTPFFLDYIGKKSALTPFYQHYPHPEHFGAVIGAKGNFPATARQTLVEVLQGQYSKIKPTAAVTTNIGRLGDPQTFTVTTGHQLNIFTGPLYFIYKIVTVINACRRLKALHPSHHFVPVYWMASEDHDFEEISGFRLYGKKYKWSTAQKGAVGRMDPRELKSLLAEVPGEVSIFRDAYLKQQTLADAVRYYVDQLFGSEGLVVIDADDRRLKHQLADVMRADLFDHMPFEQVTRTLRQLEGAGYKPQVNPREINFFYLDHQLRERIEQQGDRYVVLNTDLSFSREELEQLISTEPEKFSPNVILRPVYQELILPNLAYCGGPAELVYWLELKGIFDQQQLPFPVLLPRNFALVLDGPTHRKMEKTGMPLESFFEAQNFQHNSWVLRFGGQDLTVSKELDILSQQFDQVRQRAKAIDPTLEKHIQAEQHRAEKSLQGIEHKMLRAEKRRHADRLRQLDEVRAAIYPGGGLQERTDNFLNFHQSDPAFIQRLLTHFDPFDFRLHALLS
ncbi:MAG: bacillithiol biosynthesis cysteine-adding enzyme BshC [Cyclobacteriaceae bacterium]